MDLRSRLPSVDSILQNLNADPELEPFSHIEKTNGVRRVMGQIRSDRFLDAIPTGEEIVQRVKQLLLTQKIRNLHRVVNATGIILHTGLGRAALPREAMDAVAQLGGYCNLQIDLEEGTRGRRDGVVESLLCTITGAEAATVVNNNAAATLLVLAALCAGKECIVSRGQLIEIGGSFRLPDVIAQSGARMVEVGTTNKTHLRDYVNAITEDTRAILRVNPSNYRIIGFSKSVPLSELVTLKEGRELVVIDDLGCGALVDLSQFGLPKEPTAQESVKAGADVTLFSGDKLIGGPQSGIIIGRKAFIEMIRKHPLARALRVGKFTIAALEATLRLFLEPETLPKRHPIIRMISRTYGELKQQAETLQKRLSPLIDCEAIEGESACGGGALPDAVLKTSVVAIYHKNISPIGLAKRLRTGEPTVIARIQDDRVCIDVRTLLDGDDERIAEAVRRVVHTLMA